MESEKKTESREQRNGAWPYLISGVAIGSALGVLLAPEAGKETRNKIVDWLKEKRQMRKRFLFAKKEQITQAIAAGRKAYREDAEKILNP